jgi:hypothetical protein
LQRAESREQRAESREQRAESRGQRAEGRGQRAEGRGQRAEGSTVAYTHVFIVVIVGVVGVIHKEVHADADDATRRDEKS